MTPNRRSRSSVALVAAVGTLVLGGAAPAVAADLAPGLEKDGMFRDGAFAQDAAPGEVDIVSAAIAAVRGAAGEPSVGAGAFAGEAGGFDRLREVGYGSEGGLMASRQGSRHHQHGAGRFADAAHPALAAIAAAVNRFGSADGSFAAPVGAGAFDSLRGNGADGRFKTTRLPVDAGGYDAVREAAAEVPGPAASGLMSDAVAGTLDPASIRAAASYVTGGRFGYSAPLSGLAGLPGAGDAAFAADADAGMAARLRRAAVSVGALDDGFSASIGTGIATGEATDAPVDPGLRQPDFGMSGDAAEAMRDLVEHGS